MSRTPGALNARAVISVAVISALRLHAAPPAQDPERVEFSRLVAHWAEYSRPDYLEFLDEAKPEIAQVGFYGAHFWSLAATAHGGGYPAHFPLRGHRECGDWFEELNRSIQKRGIKVVGHLNVGFLVGDPESPEGPRGFFRFYRDQWDSELLGPRPAVGALELLEQSAGGAPLSGNSYSIGGMREYRACLRNPHWRGVLKSFVRAAIARGVDGLIANYFYRHDCLCEHCVAAFRSYLANRYTAGELGELFAIEDIATHEFSSIPAWHEPVTSTLYQREALRFSQIGNQDAFDEVFVEYGRSLKPNLIVAQWDHLGDFVQLGSDERCMLPAERWAIHEDYTWYSTGGAANFTKLREGLLGEATLQARYVRGAMRDRPFTLGKYESVRIRASIAELAANGGAPMGFYTRFEDPQARKIIARYYSFLHRHDRLYHGSRSHGEVALLFPRSRVHMGDVESVARFRSIGRALLDAHVLFDVLPDDLATTEDRARFAEVVDAGDPGMTLERALAALPARRSTFDAPTTMRVSASRPAEDDELTVHFVSYDREERGEGGNPSGTIADEKPVATSAFAASVVLPDGHTVERVEFLAPELELPVHVECEEDAGLLRCEIPSFLVYGVLRVRLRDLRVTPPRPRIAALATEYRHNSHADVILSRIFQTDTLDGKGRSSPLDIVSLYVDQRPENDTSRFLAASHRFRLSPTIADALTLGSGELAVDGVLLIAEHGDYPRSPTGNTRYPKRRFWDQVLEVFRSSGRAVPVFIDKHLADNWEDAKHIYDTAREVGAPLMAGSSLPGTWRRPAADVPRGAKLEEIVAISYHTTDAYGFHTLELAQALAEQRQGGETGIRAIEAIGGDSVWKAFDEPSPNGPRFAVDLFKEAWSRLSHPLTELAKLRERVAAPQLFRLDYVDGLRVWVIELNGAAGEWAAAWRLQGGTTGSALFWTQEGRPGMHFTLLLSGIEAMMLRGEPSWNVERTLLTSGALDAMLISRLQGGRPIETPYLGIRYQPTWRWRDPPFPPPMRPWSEQ